MIQIGFQITYKQLQPLCCSMAVLRSMQKPATAGSANSSPGLQRLELIKTQNGAT